MLNHQDCDDASVGRLLWADSMALRLTNQAAGQCVFPTVSNSRHVRRRP